MASRAEAIGASHAPEPARMRSLLISWAILAAIWAPGFLLVELLVLRHVRLNAAALWTGVLVSACQALALESLAAPLGLGAALSRLRASFRRPATWLPWGLAAVALASVSLGGDASWLTSATLLLAGCAALLLSAAVRARGPLASARGATLTLALLLLLAVAGRLVPALDQLPASLLSGWPPGAARLPVLLAWLSLFFFTLFRVQRALADARPASATWLSVAAGLGALGLVLRFLPLSLEVVAEGSASSPRAAWLLAAAGLAAAGSNLFGPGNAR